MMWWPNMMGGFLGSGGFILMIFIFIFTAVIIVGIIILVVWLVKRASYPGKAPNTKTGNSIEILKERYARGEITKKEFDTIKKDIG